MEKLGWCLYGRPLLSSFGVGLYQLISNCGLDGNHLLPVSCFSYKAILIIFLNSSVDAVFWMTVLRVARSIVPVTDILIRFNCLWQISQHFNLNISSFRSASSMSVYVLVYGTSNNCQNKCRLFLNITVNDVLYWSGPLDSTDILNQNWDVII